MQMGIYNKELNAVFLKNRPSEKSTRFVISLCILRKVRVRDIFIVGIKLCKLLVVHFTCTNQINTLLIKDLVSFVAVSFISNTVVVLFKCGNIFVLAVQIAIVLLKSYDVGTKLDNSFQCIGNVSACPTLVISGNLIPYAISIAVCSDIIGHYGKRSRRIFLKESLKQFSVLIRAISSCSYVKSSFILINAVSCTLYVVVSSFSNLCDASGVVLNIKLSVPIKLTVYFNERSCRELSTVVFCLNINESAVDEVVHIVLVDSRRIDLYVLDAGDSVASVKSCHFKVYTVLGKIIGRSNDHTDSNAILAVGRSQGVYVVLSELALKADTGGIVNTNGRARCSAYISRSESLVYL